MAQRLPRQRKTQRDKLAVLIATMLHVRSANLVEMAAGLPRASDRWDMGYQWISRFLANGLVCCDEVMAPFAREILAWLAESGEPIPLILAALRGKMLRLAVEKADGAFTNFLPLSGLPQVKGLLAPLTLRVEVPALHGQVAREPPVVAARQAEPAVYELNFLAGTGTAIFLASRAGAYLTGAIIPVDGGATGA